MIRRAMIMAAGLGLRMRPLTNDRPKPLITVAGKPLIDHALDRLVAAGVEMAVVNLHYRGDMLRAHLDKRRDIEIRYSDESEAVLDTGGGVVQALPHFEGRALFRAQFGFHLGRGLQLRAADPDAVVGRKPDGCSFAAGGDGVVLGL